MTAIRSRGTGSAQLSRTEVRKTVDELVTGTLGARLAALERAIVAKRAARQAAINDVAEQLVAFHDRVVKIEVERGLRSHVPIRKANATLAERLREIAADSQSPVRKNGIHKDGRSPWEGFFS